MKKTPPTQKELELIAQEDIKKLVKSMKKLLEEEKKKEEKND